MVESSPTMTTEGGTVGAIDNANFREEEIPS
jgi:hypothetical protein